MNGLTYEQILAMRGGSDMAEDEDPSRPSRGYTLDEIRQQQTASNAKGPSELQKGFGNAAMLVDMALNLPSDVLGIGANIGARVAGLISGGDRRENAQSAQRIQQEAQDLASRAGLIRDPAKKLMGALGYGNAYESGAVGGVMESVGKGISKAGEVVERGTGGVLLKEDVEDIVGETMTLGGPSAIYHGGKAMLKKAGGRSRAAEPPVQQFDSETPPEAPGPIAFERKLSPDEAGTFTKTGRQKSVGQPYESLRDVPAAERIAMLKGLDSEARGIVDRLRGIEPAENGMPTPEQIALSKRLQTITETQRTLREVEPSSPLARETVYGKKFGRFPEGDQPGFSNPDVQPGFDFSAFKAERTANPLIQRIRAERQAQVDAGFRTKEAEVDQAWKEYKAGQLRESELDGRRQELADVEDQLMRKVDKQKGEISTDQLVTLAALSGATAAGLYAYTHPEQQTDIATAVAAIGGVLATKGKLPAEVLAHMPTRALGPILAEGKYTLKTLDRLPQNRTEFNPAQVRQELNKPGTAAGEKLALEPVLEKAEAERRNITADELVSEFRKQTGDHTLTPRESLEHATHGLERIRDSIYSPDPAKTIIWQFPEHMYVSTSNHFGDPRYYGHTREFREDGVDHVMEIQSDLAQSLRKPMTPEELAGVEAELAKLESSPKVARRDLTATEKDQWQKLRMSLLNDETTKATLGKQGPSPEYVAELRKTLKTLSDEAKSLTAKMNELAAKDAFETGAYNPENFRLGQALRIQRSAVLRRMAAIEDQLDNIRPGYKPLTPALRNAENRLIREKLAEAAAKGDESVRFATADTVAEVEGWPLKEQRINYENHYGPTGQISWQSYEIGEPKKGEFEWPGHQSLYDRYAKETTSYLQKLGGKKVVDAEGNTWLEVPTGVNQHILKLNKSAEYLKQQSAEVAPEHTALKAFYDEEVGKLENEIRTEQSKQADTRPFGGRSDSAGQGPIHMYGQADPRLLAAAATAAGLSIAGYSALSDEQKAGVNDYLQAIGAFGAVASTGKKLKGSAAREFKVDLAKTAEPEYKARQRLVEMPISDFLKLAKQDPIDSGKTQRVSTIRKIGEKFDTVPYLYFDVDGSVAKVTGHEGRHRARQLAAEGYTTIPVEIRGPIRWSEQADPDKFDYRKTWPEKLIAESGNAELPFPVSRENAASAWTPEAAFVGPKNQQGFITPDQALKYGAMASGAAIGGYIAGDERLAGAVIGGIGGLAATRLPALGRSIGKTISPQQALGTAVRISAALGAGYYLGGKVDYPVEGAALASAILLGRKFLKPNSARESDAAINTRNGNLKSWDRVRATTVENINKLVPDQARREAIAEAIQVGARGHLSENERPVYDLVRQMNDEIGKDAVDAKILRSLRENYITSIVEFAPGIKKTEQQALIDKILGRLDTYEGAGPGTRFARARKYDTFSELNKAIEGTELQIKTKDVGEIFNLYTKSMRKAIEDRILIDFHKTAKATDGLPYIAKRDSYKRFPPGFRKIDHPQLDNVAVHPEAYDGLKIILENSNPNIVTAGLYGLSQAVKRSNVFGSLFHAKSLAEVYILAMGSSIIPKGIRDWKRPKTVIDQALKQFHEGGLGDTMDGLIKEGLQLEVPDDVSTTIIGDLGRLADSKFNTKLGSGVADKIDYVNKKTDKATWDYMHVGGKSAIALKAVETFTVNNAELHAKDPARYPLKSKQEIYREAARFANDATGGLDWFRIATEAKTELGRSVAMYFASPGGRRLAQIIAFAPDWAVSTLRAGFNSFGKSETGFRGLLKPTNAVDLYRQYALRSAALWITVLNGMQYALTGTPIWENKDPTRLEFADGTSLQPAKHSAEAAHAVMDPVKFAMNKLGFVPSLLADVASARYGAGPLAQSGDSIVKHTVKKALPFTASPLVQPYLTPGQRIGRSLSGAGGVPIYGLTEHQKLMARKERMIKNAEKRRER